MKYEVRTEEQLIQELEYLRLRVAELEKSESDRQRAKEALRESEESYRTLFENAYEAIFVAQDGKLVFLNPKTVMMIGYSAEEILSKPFIEFIHPDDRDMVVDRHVRRMKGEEISQIYHFRIIHKNGNVRWVELNVVLINWKGRRATLNFLSDITERKQTEEALRESEERYRALIEKSNDGIALIKGDRYLFVNQKMVEIFGYDRPEEIIGQSVDLLINPEDRERVVDIKHRRQKGESVPNKYEFRGQRKNGESFNIEASATQTIYQGEPVSLAYLRDITDRKQAEEAFKTLSLTDDLTGLYNRRGFFALAEQGLKNAQRMRTEMLLIFGDLDNLKGINDTFGHKEGDQALVDTAQILKETFRESDIIARIGGDEFVILAMNSVETSAEKLIQRLKKVLKDNQLQTKRPYTLSLSLGISFFDPRNPCSIDALLAQADKLMYENKPQKCGR
ncbi:MAG: PAS domain S-box protein [Deltaproteobacteria bacterium]|nr:PAS domain S-box protein [Deltaproteobacteria bacterium]